MNRAQWILHNESGTQPLMGTLKVHLRASPKGLQRLLHLKVELYIT